MILELILGIVLYILFLLFIFLQHKGIINKNSKKVQIFYIILIIAALFLFIYNSIFINDVKHNLYGFLLCFIVIVIKIRERNKYNKSIK